MWSEVELSEIRVFLGLAEELHFGRTAERLHITPSYASQLIRRLETRLGGRLFDRTSRRVRLTPLGEQYCEECRTFMRSLGRGDMCPHCDGPVAVSDLLGDDQPLPPAGGRR